ncbi:ATP-binding protein [Stigmatella sp. ncwal1]|uniref:histidine kinase n=1 Tax=Stigmatella ashevillensis TaxID=2995309 RepID=A0ABT5D232_9BACT|nr:ATP-binding protein [Stigmatella ashevillena]MDC0707727.1 ATP-binding protein [Stigmatella ashevillena]
MRILLVTIGAYPELIDELTRLGHLVLVEPDAQAAGRVLATECVEVLAVEATRLSRDAQWLESLRASAAPGTLILGLAPCLDEAMLAPLLAAGVDEFLVAPFPPVEVRTRLGLLAHRRAAFARQQALGASSRNELSRMADVIQIQSDIMQAGLDLQRVMERICEQARALCEAEGVSLGLLEADMLRYRVSLGSLEPFSGLQLQADTSLASPSLLSGEVLLIDDTETDSRVNREGSRRLGIRSMITVPLKAGGGVKGVLNIVSARPHAFGERSRRTLELLAVMLGAAMANASDYEAKQTLVAEHGAALAALQDTQQMFTSFMDNSPALALMKDAEGRYVWANEPFRRFYTLGKADLRSMTDAELMPPEVAKRIRQQDLEVLETGQPSVTEAIIPSLDGKPCHWITYRFTLRDKAGQKLLAHAALDITEHTRTEVALRHSEESFRSLIERSPEAIFVHRGGPLVYVNPSALVFLKQPASRVEGSSLLDFVHPEDRALAQAMLGPPGRGQSGARELRFLSANGRVLTAEVSCLSLAFLGEPATVISARDLTERRQMQTRLVLSDRLVAMGTLAAGVAHEINNPLAFVVSNLDFMSAELQAVARELPPGRVAELEEVLREASMGTTRMRQIVGDLKMLSRADDEAPAPVNLKHVIESALTIARAELRPRARVVRDYMDIPRVQGSEGRFAQVFLNLFINAAQAITPGQPENNEIRITLRSAQQHVIVEVKDTGGGIPADLRARIFDPFFTTKPVGEGTGLGLFVCQGIVTSFGGEISVDSQPGQGTTFRLIFPAEKTLHEPVAQSAMPACGAFASRV